MKKFIDKLLNTNIKTKLIAMFIVVIVPVFAAGVYLIMNTIGVLQESTVREAYKEVESLKLRLSDTLFTTSAAADVIYNDENINYILNSGMTHNEYLEYYAEHSIIKNYTNVYSQISDITFFVDMGEDPNGFLYNISFQRITEQIRNSNWFKEAMSTDVPVWSVMKNPSDGEIYLSYIRKKYSENGEPLGVMVVYINRDWIETLMEEEVFNVIFAVKNGMVFYSNMEQYDLGTVFTTPEFELDGTEIEAVELTESSPLTEKGYTVAANFNYRGSFFQIYLVKPYAIVTGATKQLSFGYTFYIVSCFLLSVMIAVLFTSYFVRRIKFLKEQMHKVAVGDFDLDENISGEDEINELYGDLQIMVKSMQELMNEAYEAKIQTETFRLNQVEAEFKTLASQINPHFLYNTLETIRMKAYVNNDKETADLVKKLGKFMRRCLEVKNSMVSLESELEFTKSYLELQSARFGDRVSYSIENEIDGSYPVLPLIIQPIVENAFVHGIEGIKGSGRIDISIKYSGENVIIEVDDNGQGIPDDKMSELRWKLEENDTSSGKSIGLTNVNKRIKMFHGDSYGLSFSSKPGKGTRVRITLPKNVNDEE